ncbi:sensor histidine kinase [Bacillus sp. USDA818B3_A]|uniref:sensor histidine kinase n=1 Tax=Bacillus sp. USDA818B3_A TaxID=2698834 RepID=UPI00136D1F37|nr:histidine kinase [Bacillus sp. USDA818B3_A]
MSVIYRKFKQHLYQDNIRYKYFLLMICLSIFPLVLLGVISFNIAKDTLVQNQLETTKNHLKTSSEQADLLFRNIINIERNIIWNKDVRQELIDSAAYFEEGKIVLDKNTADKMQGLVSSYSIDTQDIDSVCLFDVYFRPVCYGNPSSQGKYDTGGIYGGISHSEWYKRSVEAQGQPIFLGYNVLAPENSNSTFSSVKLLRDPQNVFNPRQIGLLVVNIKKRMFSRVFNDENKSEMVIFDSSQEGVNTVYSNPTKLSKDFSQNNDTSIIIQKLEQKGYLVSSYINETTDWTFTSVIKEKDLLKQPNQIGTITALISLAIALITLFMSYILSGKVSKPLLHLKKMVLDWSKGFWGFGEDDETDTVGVIGKTFQRITVEHKELNEQLVLAQLKEREAELRALQAQIKPHFLYNTLNDIYWMAVVNNQQDIAKATFALSESFKLSLNKGEDLIPVSKELAHIQHYLTIQNMRNRNRFRYIEDVAPVLMEKKILKLLLQPIIENAVCHGIEPKGEGVIELIGRVSDEWVTFIITDNGVGIEDIQATENGYGLRNVRDRLKLFYGQDSTLSITSKVHEGTSIEIRFHGGIDKC